MTNREIINEFINNPREKGNACNHLLYKGNGIINYSTLMCTVDRENKKALLNVTKYSRTTSKIQGMIRYELECAGFEIEEVHGEFPRNWWNYGYMGAPGWRPSDCNCFAGDDLVFTR